MKFLSKILISTLLATAPFVLVVAQEDLEETDDSEEEDTEDSEEPDNTDNANDARSSVADANKGVGATQDGKADAFNLPDIKDLKEQIKNQLGGGLGVTVIDGETYVTLNFNPEIALFKKRLGIGLNIWLRISTENGKIRKEDWSDGAWRKVLRYVRWGFKNQPDPLYIRVGVLDSASLGNGFLIGRYTNSPSFEDRRIGLEFDMDFTKWGWESVYADFYKTGLVGFRPFVRPFQFTPLKKMWIIGGIEIGGTTVADLNENGRVLEENSTTGVKRLTPSTMTLFGADISAPIANNRLLRWTIYFDYGRIHNYGDGQGFGTALDFSLFGSLLNLGIKAERRNLNDQFIPNYFNALYDIQRYRVSNGVATTKASEIESTKASGGSYGSLNLRILSYFAILGSFQKADENPDGNLHLETRLPDIPKIELRAGYDRTGIKEGKDFFKLDENSLLFAFVGYKPFERKFGKKRVYAIIGVNFQWTFKPVGNTYEVQKRWEPMFQLNYQF